MNTRKIDSPLPAATTGFRSLFRAPLTRLPPSVATCSAFPLRRLAGNKQPLFSEWHLLKWIAIVGAGTGFLITVLGAFLG